MPSENCEPQADVVASNDNAQDGGKFAKRKGRRAPLKKPLTHNEFYCLTCKAKRKVRALKNIEITTAKNGRKLAKSQCTAKDCTRKLLKFMSNEQADKLKEMKDKSKK